MPLFSRAQRIPSTSYGYSPPVGATTKGWYCLSDGCSQSDIEPVSRWPKSCPGCGGPTDPVFNEPWAHEAKGLELYFKLQSDPEAEGGYSADGYVQWRYQDALRRQDWFAAEKARNDGHERVSWRVANEDWYFPGNICFVVCMYAMRAGRLDDAADEIKFWYKSSSFDNVDNNNSERTNARQLVAATTDFLSEDQARTNVSRDEVRDICFRVRDSAANILTLDNTEALRRLGLM